jgi:hypothetical protein
MPWCAAASAAETTPPARLFGQQFAGDLLTLTDPRIGPKGGTDNEVFNGPREPFHPFSLAPHQFRVITMWAVLHSCSIGELTLNSAEMSFRLLGLSRTQLVPFPFDLTFTRSGSIST